MKWISVNEKLPEKANLYIVFIQIEGNEEGFFKGEPSRKVDVCYYFLDCKYERQNETHIIYHKAYKWQKEGVTHWMALPEKPSDEDVTH